ncbi:hypothetical protein [Frateuria aurantia]|uniref:Uncharacterized protein n=1 Tax=Frateuria aurantia (strain ATCC 33424 / DSM 6220 / KCTC 2777 / LMG 1558 / NBRC 3245 / NCIMB 13370) TaxID=767434 RepID=H8L2J9_FRAAD|nr:hypothetical protein [Frateuria aurantia]AFC85466.1 hypothetical protein Fraau_1002 [Frateuria aurantia DSM 6220]
MATTTDSGATTAAADTAATTAANTSSTSTTASATAATPATSSTASTTATRTTGTSSATATTVTPAAPTLPVTFKDLQYLSRVLILDDGRTLQVSRSKVTAYDAAAYAFLASRVDFAKS